MAIINFKTGALEEEEEDLSQPAAFEVQESGEPDGLGGVIDFSTGEVVRPGVQQPEQAQAQTQQQDPVSRGRRKQRGERGDQLLAQIESGELLPEDITEQDRAVVKAARNKATKEIDLFNISEFVGEDAGFLTSLTLGSTFDSNEFGKILSDQFPHMKIDTDEEGQVFATNTRTNERQSLNKPGPSVIDFVQGGGTAAAFVPAALATAALAPAAGAGVAGAVATGLIGGALAGGTELGIQVAQEAQGGTLDEEDVLIATGFGIASEVAIPFAKALKAKFTRDTPDVTQEARKETLEKAGLQPTKAQVTRDATDFQGQQEFGKKSGAVRDRLEQQEARLQGAFEQRAVDTQGNIVTSGNTAVDEILERSINADEKVGQAYEAAKQIAPGAKDIKLTGFNRMLNEQIGDDPATNGLISSLKGELKKRGVLTKDGKRIQGRIDVETAEQVRKKISALHDSTTPLGRQLSRDFKEALDSDVFAVKGEDLFEEARGLKRAFEESLSRGKLSKFDDRNANLVRDMLNNKISPENFVNDVIFTNKSRPEDLSQLKLFLNETPAGQQAWNDIRAQVLDEIKNRSFTGATRSDGVTKSLSRNALEAANKKLGNKAAVLFTPEERTFLKEMEKIANIREPVPGTLLGKGPSGQISSEFKTRLRARIPFIGPFIDLLDNRQAQKALLKLPKRKRGVETQLKTAIPAPLRAAPQGILKADEEQQPQLQGLGV